MREREGNKQKNKKEDGLAGMKKMQGSHRLSLSDEMEAGRKKSQPNAKRWERLDKAQTRTKNHKQKRPEKNEQRLRRWLTNDKRAKQRTPGAPGGGGAGGENRYIIQKKRMRRRSSKKSPLRSIQGGLPQAKTNRKQRGGRGATRTAEAKSTQKRTKGYRHANKQGETLPPPNTKKKNAVVSEEKGKRREGVPRERERKARETRKQREKTRQL